MSNPVMKQKVNSDGEERQSRLSSALHTSVRMEEMGLLPGQREVFPVVQNPFISLLGLSIFHKDPLIQQS